MTLICLEALYAVGEWTSLVVLVGDESDERMKNIHSVRNGTGIKAHASSVFISRTII